MFCCVVLPKGNVCAQKIKCFIKIVLKDYHVRKRVRLIYVMAEEYRLFNFDITTELSTKEGAGGGQISNCKI